MTIRKTRRHSCPRRSSLVILDTVRRKRLRVGPGTKAEKNQLIIMNIQFNYSLKQKQ